MPPSLSSLDQRRQASLLVRYLAATTFMDGGLPATAGAPRASPSDRIEVGLRLGADDLLDAAEPLDARRILAAAAPCLEADPNFAGVLARRAATMAAGLLKAVERDDGRWMPAEISSMFDSVRQTVLARYAASCARFEGPPEILLDFHHAHAGQALEPSGRISVGGHCRFVDDAVLRSVVGLVFRDAGFDWPSACVLPYVLAHELLCHAFQGLLAVDGEPAGASRARPATDPDCAWSEGWMDTLALWLVEEWLAKGADVLPEWVARARTRVLARCAELHSSRYGDGAGRSPAQARRRVLARGAVDGLLEAFGAVGTHGARERVLGFSLSLNLARLPQARRNALNDLIAAGLEIAVDREELIAAMSTFRLDGDLCELERRLAAVVLA